MNLGEKVWDSIVKWDYLAKDTIGKQFVRSMDSVAANISEGYGRFHYRESKHFYYYARGSLLESMTWLQKSFNRELIDIEEFEKLNKEMKTLSIKLNNYIKTIGKMERK
ncbi:MAG: four helix bundle protein [Candidatus Cloacimonetes bacterium]|nr:four helix bundle protein [Candidatus Cloacimonadota bacterium]